MKIELNVDDRFIDVFRALRRQASGKRTRALTVVAICGAAALADAATKPHTFGDGDPLSAAAMNENFDEVYSAVTDLEADVAAMQESAEASRDASLTILGSTVMAQDGVTSTHGYFYLGNSSDSDDDGLVQTALGQVPITLPVGSELLEMTCYFYNNSDLPEAGATANRRFLGSLRRVDITNTTPTNSETVVSIATWPAKSAEVQAFSAPISQSILPNYGYLLHLTVEAVGATLSEIGPADRLLRHYGCKIDYRLPE